MDKTEKYTLRDALSHLEEKMAEVKSKAQNLAHNVGELCAGLDPNQPCKPLDVVRIVCPLIEKEVTRMISEAFDANKQH